MVMQTEYIPALVSRTQIQQADIQSLQSITAVILSISSPDSSLQYSSQVVQVQGGCWLGQVRTNVHNKIPLNPQNFISVSILYFHVLVWKIHYGTTVLYCVMSFYFYFSPYPRKSNDNKNYGSTASCIVLAYTIPSICVLIVHRLLFSSFGLENTLWYHCFVLC